MTALRKLTAIPSPEAATVEALLGKVAPELSRIAREEARKQVQLRERLWRKTHGTGHFWRGFALGGLLFAAVGYAAALVASGGSFEKGAVLGSSLTYDGQTLSDMERSNKELGELLPQ